MQLFAADPKLYLFKKLFYYKHYLGFHRETSALVFLFVLCLCYFAFLSNQFPSEREFPHNIVTEVHLLCICL